MNIFIRADASPHIGSGHVMRCLTLADALRARGARVGFIAGSMPEPLATRIAANGHELLLLASSDAKGGDTGLDDAHESVRALGDRQCDWLVVDHYGLDRRWEEVVTPSARATLVIDDLADRPHVCDVLLDQNFYASSAGRYTALLPKTARCLLGPEFALLRNQFAAARGSLDAPGLDRLFVSLGGHDPYGLCEKVVAALRILGPEAPAAEIVAGADERLFARIHHAAAGLADVNVHGFVDNVAALMAKCTMAVGGGGSSTWERCALGLPSLVVVIADNQRQMVQDLAQAKFIVMLGEAVDITPELLARSIADLRGDVDRRSRMRSDGMQLVDGLGVQRVIDRLQEVLWHSG